MRHGIEVTGNATSADLPAAATDAAVIGVAIPIGLPATPRCPADRDLIPGYCVAPNAVRYASSAGCPPRWAYSTREPAGIAPVRIMSISPAIDFPS